MCTATDQGQTTPGDQGTKFWCQQKPLVTWIICYKKKKKKKKKLFVWFYTIFFMILYMYISPGKGLTTPWGQNFDVNRNLLSLQSYVASFKTSPWSLTLYNKCSLAGGRQPPGDKVLMSLHSFVASLKKNFFEVGFYTNVFFMIKYM